MKACEIDENIVRDMGKVKKYKQQTSPAWDGGENKECHH